MHLANYPRHAGSMTFHAVNRAVGHMRPLNEDWDIDAFDVFSVESGEFFSPVVRKVKCARGASIC